jgi:hypothetical protein
VCYVQADASSDADDDMEPDEDADTPHTVTIGTAIAPTGSEFHNQPIFDCTHIYAHTIKHEHLYIFVFAVADHLTMDLCILNNACPERGQRGCVSLIYVLKQNNQFGAMA